MHPHGTNERPIVTAAIAAVCGLGCLAAISPIASLVITITATAALTGGIGTGLWLLISLTGHRDHRPATSDCAQLAVVQQVMAQHRRPLTGRR